MTDKPKLSHAERGRLGGLATARKHGKEHYVALGTRGAATTNTRHAARLPDWGARGLEQRIQRRWNGDRDAYGRWLSAKGLAATDPAPWNNAFPDPGPEPEPVSELFDRDFITCAR